MVEAKLPDIPVKIMVVEDERIVALDISATLRSIGYNIVGMVSTGEEAINKTKETMPDLILMDIRLKGSMDGIKTAENIQALYDIPVIYLTAYADEHTLERAKLTEPYGYLLKPYEKRVLHSTIEMALYKRKMEGRVKESERWLSIILKSIGDAVLATDNAGQIKFMNPAAEVITGFKENDGLGRKLFDILKIENEFGQKTLEFNAEIDHTYFQQGLIKNKQGEIRSVMYTISPIKDNKSRFTGVVLVLQDITEQKKAEKEKEDLFREVSSAQERLKILSKKLLDVQESERRKLARELHDEIGQILTALKINLQSIGKSPYAIEIKSQLNESIELVDDVLNKARNLSLDLRPSMLDDLGLVPALRWFVDRQAQRAGINARVKAQSFEKRFPPEIEITCYRIAQEALTNVIRHSKSDKIEVELWTEDSDLHLRIMDNGQGFNVYSALRRALSGESTGILGMQERVELVGGKLKINSTTGEGTDVHAIFPMGTLN